MTALSIGRGRPANPKKKKAIVRAAYELFVDHGYCVSMDDIAAKAGVSKQTIYNLSLTKEILFGEVIAVASTKMVEAIPSPDESATIKDGLLRVAHEFLRLMTGNRVSAAYRMMINAPGDSGQNLARAYFENGPDRVIGYLADYFMNQNRLGRLHVDDVRMAAECFFGMLNSQIQVRNILKIQHVWDEDYLARKAEYCVAAFLAHHGHAVPGNQDAEAYKIIPS